MSCIHTTYNHSLSPANSRPLKRNGTVSCASFSPINPQKLRNYYHARLIYSGPKRLEPINGLGGFGNASNNENDAIIEESLRKRRADLANRSTLEKMQDWLGGGSGGSNRKPPPGGGGSDDDETGGLQNFAAWLDEVFQVFMATLGLISVYIYVIRGDELLRLGRDYLKFLIWGRKSRRLRGAMNRFDEFKRFLTSKMSLGHEVRGVQFGTVQTEGAEYYNPFDPDMFVKEMREKRFDKERGDESDDED